ncbi:unnamed protein product [Xylocopa violacea]|uniref:Uncharacterized protein n=1 Tax=Xylocopa violacea TaxID=135666 RepID=A0ABP1PIN5_XYLVO
MKEKRLRMSHCQDASENFAKLEAERDGRFCSLRRDIRFHSGGEDSDCADTSAMDKSVMESGSSTSASSCTNSPKRMWPPASRCQSHMKWTKTLPTINQAILPSKHVYAAQFSVSRCSQTNHRNVFRCSIADDLNERKSTNGNQSSSTTAKDTQPFFLFSM